MVCVCTFRGWLLYFNVVQYSEDRPVEVSCHVMKARKKNLFSHQKVCQLTLLSLSCILSFPRNLSSQRKLTKFVAIYRQSTHSNIVPHDGPTFESEPKRKIQSIGSFAFCLCSACLTLRAVIADIVSCSRRPSLKSDWLEYDAIVFISPSDSIVSNVFLFRCHLFYNLQIVVLCPYSVDIRPIYPCSIRFELSSVIGNSLTV